MPFSGLSFCKPLALSCCFLQRPTPSQQVGSHVDKFPLRQACSVLANLGLARDGVYIQEPCCRRKAILTYFGDKSPKCQQQSEMPCDYCQDPKHVCKFSASVEEALQARATAAAAPAKASDMMDSRMPNADSCSNNHKNSAPCGTTLSASGGSMPPQSAGLWRTAASKRPAPVKPLLSRNHKVQAVAAPADGPDKCTEQKQRQACSESQAEAQAGRHVSGVSNMRRARFKVPYKVPRPSA